MCPSNTRKTRKAARHYLIRPDQIMSRDFGTRIFASGCVERHCPWNTPGPGNPAILNFVNHDQGDPAGPFGESARDLFVVNDDVAHGDACQEIRVQVGFLEPSSVTLAKRRRTAGQQLRWMLEH